MHSAVYTQFRVPSIHTQEITESHLHTHKVESDTRRNEISSLKKELRELDKIKGDNLKLIEELRNANLKLSSVKRNEKVLKNALREKQKAEESLNTLKKQTTQNTGMWKTALDDIGRQNTRLKQVTHLSLSLLLFIRSPSPPQNTRTHSNI